MSNKMQFIEEINQALEEGCFTLSEPAATFFEKMKEEKSEKTDLTENGMKILGYMSRNKELFQNLFKAKDIGDGLGIASRSVSGSMQKLVKEGFCEKIIGTPVCYKITELGETKIPIEFE